MPRKKKNKKEDLIEETAPAVETNLVDEFKSEVEPIIEPTQKPVDDLVINPENIDKDIIDDAKKMLFEPSPNNKKTLIINKIIKKKSLPKELSLIRAKLTVRPLVSSYRKSRVKKAPGISMRFKVGKERIH